MEAVHSQNSHLYAWDFSLLSLLLIPLWSDSREGQMGTSSSCRGKWREEAVSDFVWKIKLSPSEATGAGSCPRWRKATPPAPLPLWHLRIMFFPKDVLSVLCRGDLPCELQWKCQMSCSGEWIATEERGAAQLPLLKLPDPIEMFYR